jgi:hypothetical protein
MSAPLLKRNSITQHTASCMFMSSIVKLSNSDDDVDDDDNKSMNLDTRQIARRVTISTLVFVE